MLDENIKAFIVYNLSFNLDLIHLAWKSYITLLLINKVIISGKYLDLEDIFLKKLAAVVPKYLAIYKYAINLENNK